MKNFIKKLLREDLVCYHTNNTLIYEELNIPKAILPKPININDELKTKLSNITWHDISISDVGTEYLKVDLPFGDFSKSIVLRLQQTPNGLFQTHLDLAEGLQSLRLGGKIIKATIDYVGYIYSAKSRQMNPKINDILTSLSNNPEFDCYTNDTGDTICFTNNKNNDYIKAKKQLLKLIGINN